MIDEPTDSSKRIPHSRQTRKESWPAQKSCSPQYPGLGHSINSGWFFPSHYLYKCSTTHDRRERETAHTWVAFVQSVTGQVYVFPIHESRFLGHDSVWCARHENFAFRFFFWTFLFMLCINTSSKKKIFNCGNFFKRLRNHLAKFFTSECRPMHLFHQKPKWVPGEPTPRFEGS